MSENTTEKEIEKIEDNKTEEVSGGSTGFFKPLRLRKKYCDMCRNEIDGVKRQPMPIINNGSGVKDMCNECYLKQKETLGEAGASIRWLGINPNAKSSETTIHYDSNKTKK